MACSGCPARHRTSWPLAGSQRRMVPSQLPEITHLPSREKARQFTVLPCRSRTVPIRAMAPAGSGSPWASRRIRPALGRSAPAAIMDAANRANRPRDRDRRSMIGPRNAGRRKAGTGQKSAALTLTLPRVKRQGHFVKSTRAVHAGRAIPRPDRTVVPGGERRGWRWDRAPRGARREVQRAAETP